MKSKRNHRFQNPSQMASLLTGSDSASADWPLCPCVMAHEPRGALKAERN